MTAPLQTTFQIGKNGISQGTLDSLHLAFKNHKVVRVSVLKSSGRDRESIRVMADDLCSQLKKDDLTFSYKILGFTIILRRHSSKNK